MKMIVPFDLERIVKEHPEDDYCCERMKKAFLSNKFELYFAKRYAETLCKRRESGAIFWKWDFCPFCSKNIKDKCDKFEKVLKDELNIDTSSKEFDWDTLDSQLPEEFKTDEWWKKRGL